MSVEVPATVPEVVTTEQIPEVAVSESAETVSVVSEVASVVSEPCDPPIKKARKSKKISCIPVNVRGLSRPAMHRIKRAANVDRLDADAVDKTREVAHIFLKKVLEETVLIARHQKRKTIRADDVQEALEMMPQEIFPTHASL
jgi:histone H3/H4